MERLVNRALDLKGQFGFPLDHGPLDSYDKLCFATRRTRTEPSKDYTMRSDIPHRTITLIQLIYGVGLTSVSAAS